MFVPIDSLDDPRLEDYTRLTDVALRRKLETERGLYMAEGDKVMTRAVAGGHTPRSFLTAPKFLPVIEPVIAQATGFDDGGEVPVFVASDVLMEELTGFHVHRGALAAFNRPELPSVEKVLEGAHRILVLENLVNHTNVGAVFRSAAALNIDAVLATPTCSDPLYRRAVRVSMGTVFQVPWTRIEDWPRSISQLKDTGWITASLALRDDALAIDEFSALESVRDPESKVALILGTEGDGLSSRTIASADYSVIIPMAHGVDSLNVAAAGALAAWELRRR
ncbi:tRNA G18 (ribose-2'-O)-methylase SpoU [Arcanobacterium wilhelmae]|uniref:tRNA G18 (Ribose-2'-O)-methylase SpoU n=1 Tax=Arcanobacterium wilhelmae TaxID=1803177 RepID=A0ABT9N8C9_9ACTO|nr:RNA methyltransferase [Arcanobacterium wilhelmae]MDP9799954.1 tRNA G18 (ribose-2'-O)-methylase SpoU [Arcanobacterium wilhelmae]WFN91088.1 RNA methyltransferase [Arcanobacterium wilhelmae]